MVCQETNLRKVMINKNGDGLFLNRLFSYLKRKLPFTIENLSFINKHVFLIETKSGNYILKAFPSKRGLTLQEEFTDQLKKSGFLNTYSFLEVSLESPIFFENNYYGIIQYIPPSHERFTYGEEKNRVEGLSILMNYHHTTKRLTGAFSSKIRWEPYLIRMRQRLATFERNLPVIKFFIDEHIIQSLLQWGKSSLNGLEDGNSFLTNEEYFVILHGDVAHHNFLRSHNGNLYLIDFDLISLGPSSIDYLQYANRILPHLDWSLETLNQHGLPFLQDRGFLYGLTFPTDIMREWNRLIRERRYSSPSKVRPLVELTIGQFVERKNFVEEIMARLQDLGVTGRMKRV